MIFRLKVLLLMVLFPILWPLTVIVDELGTGAREFKYLVIRLIEGKRK